MCARLLPQSALLTAPSKRGPLAKIDSHNRFANASLSEGGAPKGRREVSPARFADSLSQRSACGWHGEAVTEGEAEKECVFSTQRAENTHFFLTTPLVEVPAQRAGGEGLVQSAPDKTAPSAFIRLRYREGTPLTRGGGDSGAASPSGWSPAPGQKNGRFCRRSGTSSQCPPGWRQAP